MAAGTATKPRKRAPKPVGPTWEEWKGMHWRERQRVRRTGLPVPEAPIQVFLPLSTEERKTLAKLGDASEVLTGVTRRFLARQGRSSTTKRRTKHDTAKQNGRA